MLESLLLCPFERLKVYLMTQDRGNRGLREGFGQGNLMRALFKGYIPLLTRQTVAWVAFLQADQLMKTTLRNHLGLKVTETIPYHYIVPGSCAVAVVSTLCIMPFDSVKTHMQKAGDSCPTQR